MSTAPSFTIQDRYPCWSCFVVFGDMRSSECRSNICLYFIFSCLIKLVKLFTCSVVVPSYTSHYYITVKFCCNAYQTRILYGRDGRTICGPLRVPKSTYVTLAHKRKQKFFYFRCSLVRRFCCKIKKTTSDNGTDGQTDEQTECDAICGPLLGRRAA